VTPFDGYLDKATHRLRIDPEVRLDIIQELRTHLTDSSAEYLDADLDKTEADKQAVEHFGSVDELSRMLWEANRSRISLRQALMWGARVAFAPALVVLVLVLLMGNLPSLDSLRGHLGFIDQRVVDRKLKKDTEESHLLFSAGKVNLEADRALAALYPDNPVYYANYIVSYLAATRDRTSDWQSDKIGNDWLDEFFQAVDRGQRIDPGNAFYNFIKASLLIRSSSETTERSDYTYEVSSRRSHWQWNCYQTTITNPETYEKGLVEFEKGLAKPYYMSYAARVTDMRCSLLPPPDRLAEFTLRSGVVVNTSATDLALLDYLAQSLLGDGMRQAREGRYDQALSLLKNVETMAAKAGSYSTTHLELLKAHDIRCASLGHQLNVYLAMGLAEQAERARAELDNQCLLGSLAVWGDSVGPTPDEVLAFQRRTGASIRHHVYWPRLWGSTQDMSPLRDAEYAVTGQIALGGVLVLAMLVMLVSALIAAVHWFRNRSLGAGPLFVFIGWGHLVKIILVGVVLPLGIYGLYLWTPISTRAFGLHFSYERVTLEYIVVGALMMMLLGRFAYRAVHQRCQTLGITTPGSPPWSLYSWWTGVGVVILVSVMGYVLVWHFLADRGTEVADGPSLLRGVGFGLAAVVVAFSTITVIRENWPIHPVGGRGAWLPVALRGGVAACGALAVGGLGRWAGLRISIREVQMDPWITGALLVVVPWIIFEIINRLVLYVKTNSACGTLCRSVIPVYATAAIFVGLLGVWVLPAMESSSVRQLHLFVFHQNALKYPDARALRDNFTRLHHPLPVSSGGEQKNPDELYPNPQLAEHPGI